MNLPKQVIDLCNMLDEKKAINILVCDTTKMKNVADYFLIATASDLTHMHDICSFIESKTRENSEEFGEMVKEGFNLSKWVVLNFDKIFVEIFTKEERKRYNLEKFLNEGGNIRTYKRVKRQLENEKKRKLLREKLEARVKKLKERTKKVRRVSSRKPEKKKPNQSKKYRRGAK